MCIRTARVSSHKFWLFESQGTSVEKSTLGENTSGRAKIKAEATRTPVTFHDFRIAGKL